MDALDEKKADRTQVEQLQQTMDGVAKRLDTDDTERAAMTSQLDRHERWHHQTAEKIGLQLDY